MAPEAGAAGLGGRPRPALLIALAATVGLLVVWWVWSGRAQAPTPATTPTTARSRAAALAARKAAVTPADTENLNVRLERETSTPEDLRDSPLKKFTYTAALSGDYRNIRRFLHDLETAPEFLVLEDVQLSQNDVDSRALNVTVQIATYYRTDGNGA